MFSPVLQVDSPPAGGAALGQVVGLSIAALIVTIVLLVVAYRYRTHQSDWIETVGDKIGALTGTPGWSAVPTMIVGSSLIVALLGFLWDVSIHASKGRDAGPLANPAHYLILYGLFAIFVAGMSAVIYARRGEKPGPAAVRITRTWYTPVSGIFIAACGFYALIGFPLDDVWHRIFGQDVTLWGPTHLMLIGGAGLSTAGIVMLQREAELEGERSGRQMQTWFRAVSLTAAFGALLIGLSVFQAEYDFGITQFRLVLQPMLIAAAAGIPLVAARLFVGRGAAVGAAVFFLLVRGIVSFLVTDVMKEAHHVFPLYLGSAIVVELLGATRLRDKPLAFGAVGGLLVGTVGTATELVWVDRVFQFPWPASIWPEALAMTVPVAVASGLCGSLFALAMQGRLPAPRISRTIVTASVLVIAAATANGLIATVPKGASASITTTQVGTSADPQIMAKVDLHPSTLAGDHPTWVQITAWQGGGVVTDRLRHTGDGMYESTKPVPVGGKWKTLLRVEDGRMLTAVPIYLPADPALGARAPEVKASASFTRAFVPEIKILQRERKPDTPMWLWTVGNVIVLICSIAIIVGTAATASRIARRIDAVAAARERETVDA